MSYLDQLYCGTTLEGFEALIEEDEVRINTRKAESPTSYLWFSSDFADATDYAGKNPRGVSGETSIVLDIMALESEIEPEWTKLSENGDYLLERDTKYPSYLRAKSYPSEWVEGYWRIDDISMGAPQPEEFEYINFDK